jgi:hypothetical protein
MNHTYLCRHAQYEDKSGASQQVICRHKRLCDLSIWHYVRQASPELGWVIWWPLIHILTDKLCNTVFLRQEWKDGEIVFPTTKCTVDSVYVKFQNKHFGTSVGTI